MDTSQFSKPIETSQPLSTSQIAKKRRQELIEEREKNSFSRYFSSVGYALLSAFSSYPILRAKLLLECKSEIAKAGRPPPPDTYLKTLGHIWKNEGKLKIFRGILPYFGFYIPFVFAKQSSITAFSGEYQTDSPLNSFVRGFSASAVSATVAAAFQPLATTAVKLMTDHRPDKRAIFEYPGPINAISRMAGISGRGSLWTGALPTWLHHTSYFTALFASSLFFHSSGIGDKHPVISTIGSSILALLAAQPFEVVASRMQYRVQTQVIDHIPQYNGMYDCFKSIIKNEGVRSLWRGGMGSFGIYASYTLFLIISTARGHKSKDVELKNEFLIQKRLEKSQQHRDRFRSEQHI